jgi:Bacterial lectin/PEP-CTERM motif
VVRITQGSLLKAAAVATTLIMVGQAQAALIDFTTMQLNGSGISATPSILTVNDGIPGEATSAFLSGAFSSNSIFSTTFSFALMSNVVGPHGDGIAFIVQNNPAGALALGFAGGGVGAGGLTNSVGVAFRSWVNNQATIFTEGGVSGGTQQPGNFSLGDQDDRVDVTIGYDGSVLTVSAFNNATLQSYNDSLVVNLATLGPQFYLGFTGGTGGVSAFQSVRNWDLNVGPKSAVPEPASWAMLLVGFGAVGCTLRRRDLQRKPAQGGSCFKR